MKIFLLVFSAAGLCICNAQTSVNNSGGDVSAGSGSVSYSIGQVFQETVSAGGNSIIQGVQQPYEITLLGVDDFANVTLEMKVYPNPTTSILLLNFPGFSRDNPSYELFDASGKSVQNAKIQSKETTIDMIQNPSGMYILRVSSGNNVLKTFKIIKK
ncbi:T9SS type A sorting domain-containing protein [Chryseobacterium sp. R2A-55]|uniref:T9SS type A sorting domain-containing protein n=1 Tax=Chryseobacterium sp. R2A-55 TaxID=2744445 RepID=UPI001F2342FD|nr:T9SS type A sorting domain-containing protein [Chryseobacterium sp. R2A-55]